MTREAVIVEAVRTPLGKRNGKLKDWHPVDLLGTTLNELIARSGVDAARVDDVICGCVSQVGEHLDQVLPHPEGAAVAVDTAQRALVPAVVLTFRLQLDVRAHAAAEGGGFHLEAGVAARDRGP